ncbi:MAG: tRNA (adenosine(37)-N6)-threonylcarbamoyltransferase complex dimerization subunit type 1 TsaB [Patescibacteria group bacterium]
MLILTLRTDKSDAEVGIFDDETELAYTIWQAHRELAETIHSKIQEALSGQHKGLNDLQAIVIYKGPGSFTGLRIGITVANTFADSLGIPIVSESQEPWQKSGIIRLQKGENEVVALPEYGALPKTTTPKH